MKSEFQTLVKAFSNSNETSVIFDEAENACPRTDGKIIILPTTIANKHLYPTLAALLHESYHCKHTAVEETERVAESAARLFNKDNPFCVVSRKQRMSGHGPFFKIAASLLNLLEDCRIDHLAFKDFANANYLYQQLVKMVVDKKEGDEVKVNPTEDPDAEFRRQITILVRYIYLRALGFDAMPEMQDLIVKKAESMLKLIMEVDGVKWDISSYIDKHIIELSINQKNMRDLDRPLTNLLKVITTIFGQQQDQIKKTVAKARRSIKNRKGHADDKLKQYSKELAELGEKSIELEKKQQALSKKNQTLEDKLYHRKEGERKLTQAQIDKLQAERQQVRDEYYQNQTDRAKNRTAIRLRNTLTRKTDQNIANLDRAEAYIQKDETTTVLEKVLFESSSNEQFVSAIGGVSLTGFRSLNDVVDVHEEVEETANFADSAATIFSKLESAKLKSSSGTINIKNVHKLFNGSEDLRPEDLFNESRLSERYNNKVTFLLDVSGSMGYYNDGSNSEEKDHNGNKTVTSPMTNMVNSVEALAKTMEDIKDVYNIEYSIFSYSCETTLIKDFDEQLGSQSLWNKIEATGNYGGGTRIIEAVDKVKAHMEKEATGKERRFIIVFTDAAFDRDDNERILKDYNFETDKMVFIGITDNMHSKKNFIQSANHSTTCQRFLNEILFGRLACNTLETEENLISAFDNIL